MKKPFWKIKKLEDMTATEWESLCDNCAKCCLVRLEDEDTGDIACTSVSCELLNIDTCLCKDYQNRKRLVKECLQLTSENIGDYTWLPTTCAYKRLHEGKDLPSWHPLITNDSQSTHTQQMSIKDKCISIEDINKTELEDYILTDS